jgi:hypothetical protein
MTTSTSVPTRRAAEPRERPPAGLRSLSFVAETGDGCRIYRQTNGLYAVCGPSGEAPARPVATLACAYAACQDMAGAAG